MTNIMFFGFLMLYICNVDKAQNKLKNRNHDTYKKNRKKVHARQLRYMR